MNVRILIFALILALNGNAFARSKAVTRPSSLITAVQDQDVDAVVVALNAGAQPNRALDASGKTALDVAAITGNLDIMRLLVENSEAFDKPNRFHHTPLNYAALYGKKNIAKYLLDQGANPDNQEHYGYTPLMRAAQRGDVALVQLLVAKGARLDLRNKASNTALDLARNVSRSKPVIDALKAAGAVK